MLQTFRPVAVVAVALLGSAGLAACELSPGEPPVAIVVNTTVDGADLVPGDGVCEVTAGVGDCTFRASIDEGNALGVAAITLPAGSYYGTGIVVTGDLSINDGAPVDARIAQWITVAVGGRLVADGLSSYNVPGARIDVQGTFVGRHLSFVGLESSGQIRVGPTGSALLDNSLFAHVFGATPTVRNEGTVVMRNVALLSWVSVGVFTTAFSNTGTAVVASSILQSCSGTPPTSLGYNSDHDGTCGLAAAGDQPAAPPDVALSVDGVATYELGSGSPLIDAIPFGVNGCGTEVLDDRALRPRPVDGDVDGTAACDIGSQERPAP